ncbi:MAG: hypothetical protein WBA29_07345 [Xanthobacteraceae bacterium]
MPSFIAFCRSEPTVRLVSRAMVATGVRAFEWARSSLISALEYGRRATFLAPRAGVFADFVAFAVFVVFADFFAFAVFATVTLVLRTTFFVFFATDIS